MKKGWFITFEGLDKAGKTTQIELFCDYLRTLDLPFMFTREPGGNPVSERIRALLLDPESRMHPMCEVLLYAASRSELVESVIEPALMGGENVVCDRYVDSSIAYQGFGRGLGMEAVRTINEHATRGIAPDMTVYLRIAPEVALARAAGPKDRIEGAGAAFYARVFGGYEALCEAECGRIVAIDADRPVAVVHEDVRRAFTARFLP
jgi:dTMP kinase